MTASESGLPGFEASVWYAMLAPTGTPADIVAKLERGRERLFEIGQSEELVR